MLTDVPRLSSEAPVPSLTQYPVCPYCGSDPARLAGIITQLGGMPMVVVFCETKECRKIHSVMRLVPEPLPAVPQQPAVWMPRV